MSELRATHAGTDEPQAPNVVRCRVWGKGSALGDRVLRNDQQIANAKGFCCVKVLMQRVVCPSRNK